jgi:hypothetical protein
MLHCIRLHSNGQSLNMTSYVKGYETLVYFASCDMENYFVFMHFC